MARNKPKYKMKTVIRLLNICLDDMQDCHACPFWESHDCQRLLLSETAYYLRQLLEKSEKGQK